MRKTLYFKIEYFFNPQNIFKKKKLVLYKKENKCNFVHFALNDLVYNSFFYVKLKEKKNLKINHKICDILKF